MSKLKKCLSLWFVVTLGLALVSGQLWAWEVSAAGGCSSPNSHPDAVGFYNTVMGFPGWLGNFYLQYGNCKEPYYKRVGSGGSENLWIDTSDIHYHVSHGGAHWDPFYGRNLTAVVFENPINENERYLDASEARNAWGDGDLEWIGFRNCNLLDDTSWKYWSKAMNQLHLILGFKTVSMVADDFGTIWANRMRMRTIQIGPWVFNFSWTVTQAWFRAVDETQLFFIISRVVAETLICYADHLHGNGFVSPDPIPDNWKWRWDHRARPLVNLLFVNNQAQVNRQRVIQRTVNETTVRQIGEAFGFEPEDPVIELADSFILARPDERSTDPSNPDNPSHVLTVYKASGRFYYQDLGKLWRINSDDPDEIPGIFSETEAPSTAYAFLTNPSHINLYPADVDTWFVGADEIVKENVDSTESDIYLLNRSVAYSRAIQVKDEVKASVVGPGATLKVYIGEDGRIIGAMGNWREVEVDGLVGIRPKEDAWGYFVSQGQKASIAPIYVDYDSVQTDLNTAVIGYYEFPGTTEQTELIPVWIFNTNFLKDSQLVHSAYTYVPAVIQE